MEFLLGRSLINALSSFEDELLTEVRETVESLGHDLGSHRRRGRGSRVSATAVSVVSPPVFSIRSPRSATRPPVMAFAMTTAFLPRSSRRTARSAKSPAPGSAFTISGRAGRAAIRHRVRFGGQCRATRDDHGRVRYEWVDTQDVWAVGYDLLIPGQPQSHGQSFAAVVGTRDHAVPHRSLQSRQLCGRGRRTDRREESHSRAVSGRLDSAGQRAALQTAVLLCQRLVAGPARSAHGRAPAAEGSVRMPSRSSSTTRIRR